MHASLQKISSRRTGELMRLSNLGRCCSRLALGRPMPHFSWPTNTAGMRRTRMDAAPRIPAMFSQAVNKRSGSASPVLLGVVFAYLLCVVALLIYEAETGSGLYGHLAS